jgi:hypothetical protein
VKWPRRIRKLWLTVETSRLRLVGPINLEPRPAPEETARLRGAAHVQPEELARVQAPLTLKEAAKAMQVSERIGLLRESSSALGVMI